MEEKIRTFEYLMIERDSLMRRMSSYYRYLNSLMYRQWIMQNDKSTTKDVVDEWIALTKQDILKLQKLIDKNDKDRSNRTLG